MILVLYDFVRLQHTAHPFYASHSNVLVLRSVNVSDPCALRLGNAGAGAQGKTQGQAPLE